MTEQFFIKQKPEKVSMGVYFDRPTIKEVKQIAEQHEISFSSAVVQLVRIGLTKLSESEQ